MWQIGLACTGLIGEAPEYDRFYLRHQGIRLDLWILGQTTRMMLGLGGLVQLADVPEWAAPRASDSVGKVLAPARRDLELAEVD
jgi:hypothetical protein